jgi:hypothetical protein
MKVLILEHHPDYRNNYAVYAKWIEWEAITAEDGTFLRDNWEEILTCEIIVIDMLVPMGGIECLELLKSKGWKKPVLLQHTTRWYGSLNNFDLKRVSRTYPFVTFKKKQWDGANMIWFLEKHSP